MIVNIYFCTVFLSFTFFLKYTFFGMMFFLFYFLLLNSFEYGDGGCLGGNWWYWILFMSFLMVVFFFIIETVMIIKLMMVLLFFFGWLMFVVDNFFFVYLIMELLMLPMMVVLLGYGAQIQKVQALVFLVFYSSVSSVPMFFFYILLNNDFFFPIFDLNLNLVFLHLLVVGFLMKFPIYMLHYWLPMVHVESPTSLSMYLAGLILKFGVFGYMLFIYVFNSFLNEFAFFWGLLGMILVLFMCIFSSDTKVMAAFSSVVHMSFLYMCLFYSNMFSFGSILFMVLGHGYISYLWFFFVGFFYHSLGTRLVYMTMGLLSLSLVFFFSFSLTMLFNCGVPLSYSFYSEVLGISSFFSTNKMMLFLMFFYYFGSFYYGTSVLLSFAFGKSFFYLGLEFLVFLNLFFVFNMNLFIF